MLLQHSLLVDGQTLGGSEWNDTCRCSVTSHFGVSFTHPSVVYAIFYPLKKERVYPSSSLPYHRTSNRLLYSIITRTRWRTVSRIVRSGHGVQRINGKFRYTLCSTGRGATASHNRRCQWAAPVSTTSVLCRQEGNADPVPHTDKSKSLGVEVDFFYQRR